MSIEDNVVVVPMEQKAFYIKWFSENVSDYASVLIQLIFELGVSPSDMLILKNQDAIDFLRFDFFLVGEFNGRDKTIKIKLNNKTRALLTYAADFSQGSDFAFSSNLLTASNRAKDGSPVSRQAIYRWMRDCSLAHRAANKNTHIDFSFRNMNKLNISEEFYLRQLKSMALMVDGRIHDLAKDKAIEIDQSLYGDEKELHKKRARDLLKMALSGMNVAGSIGYSPEDLERHLTGLFSIGMSWGDRNKWHVDHIKPISLLIKEGVTDPKIINALSNLQPLWAKDNLSKSDKFNGI